MIDDNCHCRYLVPLVSCLVCEGYHKANYSNIILSPNPLIFLQPNKHCNNSKGCLMELRGVDSMFEMSE